MTHAITLRPATSDDVSFLRRLFHDVRGPEFAALNLPQHALEPLLDMQWNAQRSAYSAQFPQALDSVVLVNGEPGGRHLVDTSETEMRLVDVALLSSLRGQGVGSALIARLIAQADAAGLPICLHVSVGNPAIHLYQRHGFVPTGGDGLNVAMERAQSPTTQLPQPMSSVFFRSLLGRELIVDLPDGQLALRLQSVQAHEVPDSANVVPGDSFTLTFTGPVGPLLLSGTVRMRLTNQDGSLEPMDLFVSPVGRMGDQIEYESVFNRMIWLA